MVAGNGNIYEFGDFRLVPGEGLLLHNGEPVPLAIKPFATLTHLVERHGHLVAKSELIDTIWGDTFVEEGAVSRSVWAIRNALGEDSKSSRFIQTVPRRGYRFVAPVRQVSDHSGAFRLAHLAAAEERDASFISGYVLPETNGRASPPEFLVTDPAQVPLSDAADGRSFTAWAAGILLVCVLAVGAFYSWSTRVPSPAVRSVAVMPLANLTGQESDAFIVDGITEHLIDSLSRIPGLDVAADSSSFATRDRALAFHEVSAELKVGHLLSGSVQRDGEFLRVSLRLIEGSTGRVVWTDGAFGSAAEIFTLQDDIASRSAEAITGNSAPAAVLGNYGTADREAYLHYLKGRYHWHKQTEADTIKGISEFERSVARDPNFALAYAGLSDSHTNLALTFRPPNDAMPKAAEYAAKALSIDPNLPDALFSHAAVNFWYRRDVAAAERSILRAIKLRPNYSMAYDLYGSILITQGKVDEGLAEVKRSVELDPLAHFQACDLTWQFYNGGRYADAAALARVNLEKVEACPFERLFLGQSLSEMGRFEEGLDELIKVEHFAADWHPGIAERARIHARMGETEKASRLLAHLEAKGSGQYVDPFLFAVIYSGFRDAERTLFWLDKAIEANSPNLVYLDRDPRFNEIKTDRRFGELLQRAGLPISASNPESN